MKRHCCVTLAWLGILAMASGATSDPRPARVPLPRIRVAQDGRTFENELGQPFVPFGVNYYRPGTGWAPQVWKQFDADATRQDFARMKDVGVNCVRVFLTLGSFCPELGALSPDGLAKFDQFLAIAEEAGIYVHPTGPDHWEGIPDWAKGDRIVHPGVLKGLESFWRSFVNRYRGRSVIFAYDLRNEPEVRWESAEMRSLWNEWLKDRYGSEGRLRGAWRVEPGSIEWGNIPPPPAKDAPHNPSLLEYQEFRETLADQWTRRQAVVIKEADPRALVTVGLIQWSVP